MKKIEFLRLEVSNFLSIGNEPIIINFIPGLNIITGENKDKQDSKNGVGKSSIPDSIYFGLYGTTIRELKKDEIVNYNTKNTTQVILSFKITDENEENYYKIVETIRPAKLTLYRYKTLENLNSNIVDEDLTQTTDNTKTKIIKLIDTTPEMFLNNYICDLGSTIPFLAQKGVAKRKYIEGIFSLDILTKMASIIKTDYQTAFKQLDIEIAKNDNLKEQLKNYQQQQQNIKEKNQERINELRERIEEYKNQIEELKKKIQIINEQDLNNELNQIKTYKNNIQLIRDKIKNIDQKLLQYNHEIQIRNKQISDLSKIKGICVLCNRPWDDADIKSSEESINNLTEEINEFKSKINTLNTAKTTALNAIEKIENKIEDLELKIKQYNQILTNNKIYQNEINSKYTYIKQCEQDIINIENDKSDFQDIINNTINRINLSNDEISKLKDNIYVMDMAKFIISDEGVKSHIIKKLLTLLNDRMNFYLKHFDSNCVCIFNEYFEETMHNEKMQPVSYFNFSAGERKRIDLAMLFTFMDIRKMRSNITSNLLIFDELLDSSLDAIGIEKTINLLKERISKYNECIYIISHNIDAVKHATGEIIYLAKEKGCTKRILDANN